MLSAHHRFELVIPSSSFKFQVLGFEGFEAISRPYAFSIQLVAPTPDLDIKALLYKDAYLELGRCEGVHGRIHGVSRRHQSGRFTHYSLTLSPRLAELQHRINRRIFQDRTLREIIDDVLTSHNNAGHDWLEFHLEHCPRLEYCVQFDETDLHFIQRLCAHHGVHFHFRHSPENHVLVFSDRQDDFPSIDPPQRFLPANGMARAEPAINDLQSHCVIRPGQVTTRHYDPATPQANQHTASSPGQPLENFDYPGSFTTDRDGRRRAERMLEQARVDHEVVTGSSDQPAIRSGHSFRLQGHAYQPWNSCWLLTEVRHFGEQPQALEEMCSPTMPARAYRNEFSAIAKEVAFRPPPMPKPLVHGQQLGIVQAGTFDIQKKIYCDNQGRVRVQLVWDRASKPNHRHSCWMRVATPWAQQGYGATVLPRVGAEVIVGFVDGDIDAPIVLGSVANPTTSNALNLPGDASQTVFRSCSMPTGKGYNEIRVEDRAGQERIQLRAQKDYHLHVLNNEHIHVGHDRSIAVGERLNTQVAGEESRSVTGTRRSHIACDDFQEVGGDHHVLARKHLVSASTEVLLEAGEKLVLRSANAVQIRVGGHFLTIDHAGIFCSVPIKTGGSPLASASVHPAVPSPLAERLLGVDWPSIRSALGNRSSRCVICREVS